MIMRNARGETSQSPFRGEGSKSAMTGGSGPAPPPRIGSGRLIPVAMGSRIGCGYGLGGEISPAQA